MKIKTLLCCSLALACAMAASAAPKAYGKKSAAEEAQDKMDAKVRADSSRSRRDVASGASTT